MIDPNALFLGPQSENRAVFEELANFLLDEHVHWRRNFHPEDKPVITPAEQRTPEYEATIDRTRGMLSELSSELRTHSMPWFSPRYLGHMIYDPMMAASLAHFAALLYNPNNVAREAAPATTGMEVEVGQQFATLFGYSTGDDVKPWGHITSGGTVANFEALWIAKTLQSIPVALHYAEHGEPPADEERRTLRNQSPAGTLDSLWNYLNDTDDSLDGILDHSVRGRGANREPNGAVPPGVVLVPQSRHYCWDKGVDLLGIGGRNLRTVAVDEDTYRMDVDDLRAQVRALIDEGTPVLAVVAVVGSPEQGAVDPVHEIVEFRRECEREHDVSFYLHVDAAYGGYARTLFVDEDDEFVDPDGPSTLRDAFPPEMLQGREPTYVGREWPPAEVHRAFAAMEEADSVTVDPHKWGYTPYAAGGFVVKDRRVLPLVSHSASYVAGTGTDDEYADPGHLGSFILEGSKSGASVASVWGAHRVAPLNVTGYGRLVGAGIEAAHHFYESLRGGEIAVEGDGDMAGTYVVRPLCEPDLNVVNFAFNREDNRDLERMNRLNGGLYERCTYNSELPIPTQEFITSKTELGAERHGDAPKRFLNRLGVPPEALGETGSVTVLRSCVLTPFLAHGTVEADGHGSADADPYTQFFEQFKRSMRTHIREIQS